MSSDIHLRASSQEIPQPSITEIIWKIKYLKFHSNFSGANELIYYAFMMVSSAWIGNYIYRNIVKYNYLSMPYLYWSSNQNISRPLFIKKTLSHGYKYLHYKPHMIWQPSQVYNGNPYIPIRCCFLNLLWPSDTIWRLISGSTLAQVRDCCLTTPSHYLNQCWLIISEVILAFTWRQFHGKCPKIFIFDMGLKMIYFRWQLHFPRANELKVNKGPVDKVNSIAVDTPCVARSSATMSLTLQIYTDTCLPHWRISTTWPILTHCGLVTPYGDRDLGQHWLR